MPSRKSFSRVAVMAAIALVAVLLMAVPGNATFAKKYDLSVSPSSIPAGTTQAFAAKYTNKSIYKIGSTELTVPTGFQLVAATTSRGSIVTPIGSTTVKVKDLNLALGASLTITVTAKAPCGAASGSWSAVTKTGNFSGSTFAYNNASSARAATVTGACSLEFVDQPSDAAIGEDLSAPDGVTVRALDGAASPVAGVPVAMTATGPGSLSGTSPVSTAAAAPNIAAFTDLSVDAAGTYTLEATAAGYGTATSDPFDVAGEVLECNESYPTESGGAADAVDLARLTGACVEGIPVTVVVRSNEVEITKPFVEGSAFEMTITWVDEAPAYPLPATRIAYEGEEGFHDMELCPGEQTLPPGEFWCVTDQSFTVLASGRIQVTESYFGAGDPRVTRG